MANPSAKVTRNLLFIRTLPTSVAELQAAITQTLLFTSSSTPAVKSLDVAVTLPFQDKTLRRQSFYHVERIINKVYSLAESDVDINVILLNEDYNACGGVVWHLSNLRRLSEGGRWAYILTVKDADDIFGPNCNTMTLQLGESDGVHEKWWEKGLSVQAVPDEE